MTTAQDLRDIAPWVPRHIAPLLLRAADELEQMRQDAERYRWLRISIDLITVLRDVTPDGISAKWPDVPGWQALDDTEKFDADIDAAMARHA